MGLVDIVVRAGKSINDTVDDTLSKILGDAPAYLDDELNKQFEDLFEETSRAENEFLHYAHNYQDAKQYMQRCKKRVYSHITETLCGIFPIVAGGLYAGSLDFSGNDLVKTSAIVIGGVNLVMFLFNYRKFKKSVQKVLEYKQPLLEHIKKHPEVVGPNAQEMLARAEEIKHIRSPWKQSHELDKWHDNLYDDVKENREAIQELQRVVEENGVTIKSNKALVTYLLREMTAVKTLALDAVAQVKELTSQNNLYETLLVQAGIIPEYHSSNRLRSVQPEQPESPLEGPRINLLRNYDPDDAMPTIPYIDVTQDPTFIEITSSGVMLTYQDEQASPKRTYRSRRSPTEHGKSPDITKKV